MYTCITTLYTYVSIIAEYLPGLFFYAYHYKLIVVNTYISSNYCLVYQLILLTKWSLSKGHLSNGQGFELQLMNSILLKPYAT